MYLRSLAVALLCSLCLRQPLPSDAYKVLVLPLLGKSQVFAMTSVADGLVARGHEVTIVVPKDFNFQAPKTRQGQTNEIQVERYDDDFEDYDVKCENFTQMIMEGELRMADMAPHMKQMFGSTCRSVILGSEKLFDRLEKSGFDLAVVDGLFFMKCLYLIPHRLRISYVTHAGGIDPFVARVPYLPSFVSNPITLYSDRMSFAERLKNTAFFFVSAFYNPFPDSPAEVFDDYRQYGHFNDLNDLMQRSLMYFTSREHLLDFAKPSMPHVINVGGLTPKPASGDLPTDFKSFVEGAKRGVVVVTFGSMASRLPKKVVEKFVDAFERLDGFRVVWRLNNIHNVKIPANVMVMSWIPQNDLLAHPSVKLFVTHSGNNGQYEAFYHGVPMIGFPLLGDQEYNALRLVKKGYGIAMNVYDFTADELNFNMRQILENPAYKQRIVKASEIFRSAPMSPVETVVYWIEHVCKFGGDHLRSGGHDLPLYAYWLLDVLAFILLVTVLFTIVVFALCWLACGKLLRRRKQKAD